MSCAPFDRNSLAIGHDDLVHLRRGAFADDLIAEDVAGPALDCTCVRCGFFYTVWAWVAGRDGGVTVITLLHL